MKVSRRRLGVLIVVMIGVIILITLIAASSNQKISNGSTYSHSPSGYGAWYDFMSKRGTPVQRWQKPSPSLTDKDKSKSSIILLRIYNSLPIGSSVYLPEKQWVEQGNILVTLGIHEPVTKAEFSTLQKSSIGLVKIDTTRRNKDKVINLLGDQFGGIVWKEKIGKGQVIYATTPYLAANAYQDFTANYEFLAQLVTESGNPIWVDEYIHGYKDADVIKQEIGENIFSYFAKTPIFPLFIQGLVILLIVIVAKNYRLGKAIVLPTPTVNNSVAYIQALAAVLQKAETQEFVISILASKEQKHLQRMLGLGEANIDSKSLIDAWVQQTGQPANELASVLKMSSQKHRLSDIMLLNWLEKWHNIRQLSR